MHNKFGNQNAAPEVTIGYKSPALAFSEGQWIFSSVFTGLLFQRTTPIEGMYK